MAERLRERRVIYGGTNSNAPIKNVTKERTSKRKNQEKFKKGQKCRKKKQRTREGMNTDERGSHLSSFLFLPFTADLAIVCSNGSIENETHVQRRRN